VVAGAGISSYHYADGGGHAIDFNYIDDVDLTGATNKDIEIINELKVILPPGSGFGQSDCRATAKNTVDLPDGITQFADTCNHLHIQVPKDSSDDVSSTLQQFMMLIT
jgi:hypothetical protein